MNQRLNVTIDQHSTARPNDVSGRVAKQLLLLAQRFGALDGGALRVTHDLTQDEIAQLVGASREAANKALANFVHRGWIQLEGNSLADPQLRRPCAPSALTALRSPSIRQSRRSST